MATGLHGQPAWEQRFMAPGPSLWPPLNSTTARFAFGPPTRMIYLYPASRRLPQAVNGVSGRRDDSNRKSEATELERATLETVTKGSVWFAGVVVGSRESRRASRVIRASPKDAHSTRLSFCFLERTALTLTLCPLSMGEGALSNQKFPFAGPRP